MRYRLICLDAGFTLLSPRKTLGDALTGVLTQIGKTPDESDMRRAWEAADRWFWDEYHRPDNDTWTDDARIEQTWRDFHGVVLRELGVGEAAAELIERILASQFSPDSWEAYPDVVPLLKTLDAYRKRHEASVGVVSDWGSALHDIFTGLELDRYVDFVLASAAVGLAKPDPAFFRVALDRAAAAPHEAIMVGDSYRADVVGARAAGIDAVLLDRDGEATDVDDVPVIRSLAELPPLLGIATDAAQPIDVRARA
jgi:HAD superfamily hydrolase (TIGR01549 family)